MFDLILAIGATAVNPTVPESDGGRLTSIAYTSGGTEPGGVGSSMLPEEEPVQWDIDMTYLINMLCYIVGCYAMSDTGYTTYTSPAKAQDLINRFKTQGIEPLSPAEVAQALIDVDTVRTKAEADPDVLGLVLKLDLVDTLDGIEEELNAL